MNTSDSGSLKNAFLYLTGIQGFRRALDTIFGIELKLLQFAWKRDLKKVDCVAEFFLISMASRLTPSLFSSKKL